MADQARRRNVDPASRYDYDRRAAAVRKHLANAHALTLDLRDRPLPDPATLYRTLEEIGAEQRAAQQAAQEL